MVETVFIRLPARSAHSSDEFGAVQWLLADSVGGRLGATMSGLLQDAAPMTANRRVVVLVPSSEVLLAEPVLPVKSGARLMQVLPFALEEHLASDVDDMHFAVGKRGSRPGTPVAAVTHERMRAWLGALTAAGINPDAVYPESTLLPSTAGAHTAVVDSGVVLLRTGDVTTALDAQPLMETLTLALPNADTALMLYITQADYDADPAAYEALRERIVDLDIKLLPEGPLPLLALQAGRDDALNLLQGLYQRHSSIKAKFEPWKYAAVLAGVAALLHVGYNGTQLWRLSRAEAKIDTQIREVFSRTLPQATNKDPNAARRQFEARINALKGGGENGGLLPGLATLGEALAQTPDTRIEALSYRGRVLDLRLSAPTVDALDKLRSLTQNSGLQSELQSATPRDNHVEGRLQIKVPGA
jgi:general secretion pathway protein L